MIERLSPECSRCLNLRNVDSAYPVRKAEPNAALCSLCVEIIWSDRWDARMALAANDPIKRSRLEQERRAWRAKGRNYISTTTSPAEPPKSAPRARNWYDPEEAKTERDDER